MTWAAFGAKMSVPASSLAHAAAGSLTVPPAGSQRSVKCAGAVFADPVKRTVSETFAAAAALAVPEVDVPEPATRGPPERPCCRTRRPRARTLRRPSSGTRACGAGGARTRRAEAG